MQSGQTIANGTAGPSSYPAPISAADAAAYCNAACISSTPGFTEDIYDTLIEAVQAGQIQFTPSDTQCAGLNPQSNALALVSVGTGLGLTAATDTANILNQVGQAGTAAAGAGEALSSAIPIIGPIVSSIVGLFTAIFQHHALVTKAEQNAECQLIPAANNYLQIIVNAVNTGQATPAQGVAALESLQSDFNAQVNSNPSYKYKGQTECSALCVYNKQLCAIATYLHAQFDNMAAVQAVQSAAAAGSSSSGSAGSGALTVGDVSVSSSGVTVGSSKFSLAELALVAVAAWVVLGR